MNDIKLERLFGAKLVDKYLAHFVQKRGVDLVANLGADLLPQMAYSLTPDLRVFFKRKKCTIKFNIFVSRIFSKNKL